MRVADWDLRLASEIDAARDRPFVWGEHDCATWALHVREVLSGAPASAWPGGYRCARGAERAMRRRGWASFTEGACAVLGVPLAAVQAAQRGDIVMFHRSFGVCVGARCAFLAPEGLVFRPLADCQLAWRV